MRSWSYSYKTSDGLRHEAEMSAPTKDAVYDALRKQGIRPIRVDERIAPVVRCGFRGLRKRDWAVVGVGLILATVGVVAFQHHFVGSRVQGSSSVALGNQKSNHPSYLKIEKSVAEVLARYRASSGRIDLELLTNYALFEQVTNTLAFSRELEAGRQIVGKAKSEIRAIYANGYEQIPESSVVDVMAAQKLYGVAIGEVESFEEELEGDSLALGMLQKHRGRWKTTRGRVIWDDEQLAKEFEFFQRSGSRGMTQWEKDFGKRRARRP